MGLSKELKAICLIFLLISAVAEAADKGKKAKKSSTGGSHKPGSSNDGGNDKGQDGQEKASVGSDGGTESKNPAPGTPVPASPKSGNGIFDVTKYGADPGCSKDSTKAFTDAWTAACSFPGTATWLVPTGTFLVGELKFNGPCANKAQSPAAEIRGTLRAPGSLSSFTSDAWVLFRNLDGLTISGGGMLDGQGAAEAWQKTTCHSGGKCKFMPVSMRFIGNNNGKIQNINFQNGKAFHLVINNCVGVDVSGVHATAPEDSPNTDGIHISGSTHVHVTNCKIGVGDDCVSIGDGNTDISIEGVTCGPGHGISVGSLGKYARETGVTGVHVKNCTLTGTTNGVRIKTWNGSPTLKASNFTFEDITMNKVSFPIIIDQNYCPGHNCGSKPSAVQISDIIYQNIKGTSFTKLAVNLICSSGAPCQRVQLNNIDLTYQDASQKVASMCQNVKPTLSGVQNPPACA
ncbi:exopolygalacturonase-like [Tasmannia lanceolata]|uniref:exopolygalacturonase-like n=1 Tax=Tasmannia lanceolata TaxID=3420 RepID=UPI004063B7DA